MPFDFFSKKNIDAAASFAAGYPVVNPGNGIVKGLYNCVAAMLSAVADNRSNRSEAACASGYPVAQPSFLKEVCHYVCDLLVDKKKIEINPPRKSNETVEVIAGSCEYAGCVGEIVKKELEICNCTYG